MIQTTKDHTTTNDSCYAGQLRPNNADWGQLQPTSDDNDDNDEQMTVATELTKTSPPAPLHFSLWTKPRACRDALTPDAQPAPTSPTLAHPAGAGEASPQRLLLPQPPHHQQEARRGGRPNPRARRYA